MTDIVEVVKAALASRGGQAGGLIAPLRTADIAALADEIERLRGAVVNAIETAVCYGGTDGEHHKAWVIDQMVRSLTHCPKVKVSATDYKGNAYEYERLGESQEYAQLIADACDGVDGPETYAWDCGIAP